MPNPIDAYREGYEKGRKDTLGGLAAEVMMGMMRDDPGGHFAAGYHDGAAGKKFNPPSEEVHKSTPRKSEGSSLTDLEKSWYHLCDASIFISKDIADHYVAALNAEGSHVAVVIGLSNFTAHTCQRCSSEGQFKIRFLGRLEHPECHWTGYMDTGSYIGFQIMQIVHSGIRAGGSLKEDAERKGEGGKSWIDGIFGFVFVAVFRAALAVVLIPLHTIVVLCQLGQTRADILKRVIPLSAFLAVLGIGIYEIQPESMPPFPSSQPGRVILPQTANTTRSSATNQSTVRPSFDCAKAHTRVELLICRDSHLAALEVEMASTFHQTLNRLAPDAQLSLQREHLAWFKTYSRTCNQSADDVDRAACVAKYLSQHTAELSARRL